MTTEQVLNSHGLNEQNCLAFSEIIDCLEDYARLQIEKDRERVKERLKTSNLISTDGYLFRDIDSVPIELD